MSKNIKMVDYGSGYCTYLILIKPSIGMQTDQFNTIINIVKMFDYDEFEDSQRFELDYLLNYSRISEDQREIGSS